MQLMRKSSGPRVGLCPNWIFAFQENGRRRRARSCRPLHRTRARCGATPPDLKIRPPLKYREIIKLVEANGWFFERMGKATT